MTRSTSKQSKQTRTSKSKRGSGKQQQQKTIVGSKSKQSKAAAAKAAAAKQTDDSKPKHATFYAPLADGKHGDTRTRVCSDWNTFYVAASTGVHPTTKAVCDTPTKLLACFGTYDRWLQRLGYAVNLGHIKIAGVIANNSEQKKNKKLNLVLGKSIMANHANKKISVADGSYATRSIM